MTLYPPASDDALDWALRVADPDFADWDGFTLWLEGGLDRAARYDAAVCALADVAAQVPSAVEPADAPVMRPAAIGWSRRWLGGALAAALVGAVGLGLWSERAQLYAVETPAGQQRMLALADGSELVLAGGSRVELDHRDLRYAAVIRGELLFKVRHDAAHPFRVRAGAHELIDLGTVFDVKRTADLTRVAVAEGAVLFDPRGAAVQLDPGQALIATGNRLETSRVEPAGVGGWRDGWLAYDSATLREVAADLSRQLARPVTVASAIAGRPFRGTLDIRRIGNSPGLLGSLLDVRVRQHDGGWTLEPRG